MPVRIAAIGVGHWHSLYDAAYLRAAVDMPDVRLVGVQDNDVALAAERAAKLGDTPVFGDYREMLSRLRPDFVIALGRPNAMADVAHHLLDEGYPFLVEKPAGLNAAEVRVVADKAAMEGTFAGVPLFQRYHPFAVHARRLIAGGAFGPLSHFHFRSNRGSSARYVAWGAAWMLDHAIAGGGCLRNIGLHGIDLFSYILGEDVQVAGAQTSTQALGQAVEDYAVVLLRASSGVLASIEVGNTFPGQGSEGEWKLVGRDGLLSMHDGAVRWVNADGEQHLAGSPATPLPVVALSDALRRWREGKAPSATIEDCFRAMRIVDRAYEMAAGRT